MKNGEVKIATYDRQARSMKEFMQETFGVENTDALDLPKEEPDEIIMINFKGEDNGL